MSSLIRGLQGPEQAQRLQEGVDRIHAHLQSLSLTPALGTGEGRRAPVSCLLQELQGLGFTSKDMKAPY